MVCREFVALCRKLDLFSATSVAIDGSKFKAVNARDKNFTEAKMKRRLECIDESGTPRWQISKKKLHDCGAPASGGCLLLGHKRKSDLICRPVRGAARGCSQ
jgi:hypothetical protein